MQLGKKKTRGEHKGAVKKLKKCLLEPICISSLQHKTGYLAQNVHVITKNMVWGNTHADNSLIFDALKILSISLM